MKTHTTQLCYYKTQTNGVLKKKCKHNAQALQRKHIHKELSQSTNSKCKKKEVFKRKMMGKTLNIFNTH